MEFSVERPACSAWAKTLWQTDAGGYAGIVPVCAAGVPGRFLLLSGLSGNSVIRYRVSNVLLEAGRGKEKRRSPASAPWPRSIGKAWMKENCA